jgi:hypothetical protein
MSDYEKYSKMLKMNLPEAAVRQRMGNDGFSPQDIDDFLSGSNGNDDSDTNSAPPSKPPGPPPGGPPPPPGRPTSMPNSVYTQPSYGTIPLSAQSSHHDESGLNTAASGIDDDRFASFVKMLKLNLPDEAIQLKMRMVGFSDKEIDGLFVSEGRKSILWPPPSTPESTTKARPKSTPLKGPSEVLIYIIIAYV